MAIVFQQLETTVSKLREVRGGQKEERKLSKCDVYSWTQYVVLCGIVTMLSYTSKNNTF